MNFPKSKKVPEDFICGILGRFSIVAQSSHSSSKNIIGTVGIVDLSEINYNALRKEIEDLNPELVGHVPVFGSSAFLYEMEGFIYLDVGKENYIRVNGTLIEDEQFVLLQPGTLIIIGGLVLTFKEKLE